MEKQIREIMGKDQEPVPMILNNIVVQNVGDKKIVTVFSNAPASSLHVKGYKISWR